MSVAVRSVSLKAHSACAEVEKSVIVCADIVVVKSAASFQ